MLKIKGGQTYNRKMTNQKKMMFLLSNKEKFSKFIK